MTRSTLAERYAWAITARPRLVVALALLVVASFGFAARHVRLDNNFAALFTMGDDAAALRSEFRRRFGADDGLLIAVITGEGIAQPGLVQAIEEISRRAGEAEEVTRVYSATETSIVYRDGEGAVIAPALGGAAAGEDDLATRVRRMLASPLAGDRLLSRDGKLFVVAAELAPEFDSYERLLAPAERFRRLVTTTLAAQAPGARADFAGMAYTRIGAIATMQGDLLLLTPLVTGVLAVMLLVFFRRVMGVVIPLACVTAAIVGTAGVVGLCGDDLNQLTVVYPILLMVITVATAVHFVLRYQHERGTGLGPREAAATTAARLTEAAFLQTLTTVIGFGSLAFSSLRILNGFGLYLAAGVVLAFACISTALPAMLVLWGDGTLRARGPRGPALRVPALYERALRVIVRPRVRTAISLAMAALFALLCLGARGVQYDYRLSDNVHAVHPTARGNALIDERLAGILPLEVAFSGPPGAVLSPATLARIDEAGQFLAREAGVHAPLSVAVVLRELRRAMTGDDGLPRDRDTVEQLLLFANGSPDRVVDQLLSADRSWTRLRATIPDRGAAHVVELQRRFQAHADALFAGSGVRAVMTGEIPVAYDGMNKLSEELVSSELWGLVLVTLSIGIVFRSAKVALASVLPNALPVLVALTLYARTGRATDPMPGIVFCIGVGLAVDDTIHVITRYREALRGGLGREEAMVQTMLHEWSALLTSSASLAIGFLGLCLSDFNMNITMGWLGALMIMLAWLFEVLCTPAALLMFTWKLGTAREPAPAALGVLQVEAAGGGE